MAQELKTKSMPEIGCIWTYFGVLWSTIGHTLDILWTYVGHTLDDLG
jgi:hypothetical protein